MIILALISLVTALQNQQIPTTLTTAKPAQDTVMATVDGIPIKVGDVDRLLWDWHANDVAQDLISYQLIQNEAAKAKVSVPAPEIEKQWNAYVADQVKRMPAGSDFDAVLRKQGLPKSRLYMQFVGNLLLTKVVDTQFKAEAYVKASTLVFLKKSATATDIADAVGKAQDAYKRLTGGESWDKVMNSTNQTPALVQNKGVLGWVQLDKFPAVSQAEFKNLKIGGISRPVETENGIQLFRLDALGATANAADLATMKADYERNARTILFQNLEKNAKVERFFGPNSVKH